MINSINGNASLDEPLSGCLPDMNDYAPHSIPLFIPSRSINLP